MKFEKSIEILADPAKVFNAYTDVSGWSLWDPEVEAASLFGDFEIGAIGSIKPKGAPKSKITLVEITENRSFTVECRLPLCKMHFVHLMHPTELGTHLINQVKFSGVLSPLFGRLIGNGINKGLPASLSGLKRHVETKN
ncbi:SRPBCC family protein [Gammaproteobacteria bacterium]|nr:SRPBCC family protein [Gammaproteobacteria bacterium]